MLKAYTPKHEINFKTMYSSSLEEVDITIQSKDIDFKFIHTLEVSILRNFKMVIMILLLRNFN